MEEGRITLRIIWLKTGMNMKCVVLDKNAIFFCSLYFIWSEGGRGKIMTRIKVILIIISCGDQRKNKKSRWYMQ